MSPRVYTRSDVKVQQGYRLDLLPLYFLPLLGYNRGRQEKLERGTREGENPSRKRETRMRILREELETSRGKVVVDRTSRIFRLDFIDDDTLKVLYSLGSLLDNIEAYKLAIALVNAGEYIAIYNILEETHLDLLIDLVDL